MNRFSLAFLFYFMVVLCVSWFMFFCFVFGLLIELRIRSSSVLTMRLDCARKSSTATRRCRCRCRCRRCHHRPPRSGNNFPSLAHASHRGDTIDFLSARRRLRTIFRFTAVVLISNTFRSKTPNINGTCVFSVTTFSQATYSSQNHMH